MIIIHKIAAKVGSSLLNFAINEDRSLASLGGAPVDFTLSGEAGKHRATNPLAAAVSDVLDALQKNHVENADAVDTVLTATRVQFNANTKTTGT